MRRDGRQATRTRADDGRRQRGAPEELEFRDARGGGEGESEGERERERGRERERERCGNWNRECYFINPIIILTV